MAQTWEKQGNLGKPRTGGMASIPSSLGLGTPQNVVVPLDTPMPTANYRAVASISASASVVGAIAVQGIVARTTTSVTVRVAMTSLISISGSVEVACTQV